jgi:hypothetical protein
MDCAEDAVLSAERLHTLNPTFTRRFGPFNIVKRPLTTPVETRWATHAINKIEFSDLTGFGKSSEHMHLFAILFFIFPGLGLENSTSTAAAITPRFFANNPSAQILEMNAADERGSEFVQQVKVLGIEQVLSAPTSILAARVCGPGNRNDSARQIQTHSGPTSIPRFSGV